MSSCSRCLLFAVRVSTGTRNNGTTWFDLFHRSPQDWKTNVNKARHDRMSARVTDQKMRKTTMNRHITNAASSNSSCMCMNKVQPRRERTRSTASSAARMLMVLPPSSPPQGTLIRVVEARPPPGLFSWTPRPMTACLVALFALVFCAAALIGASPRGASAGNLGSMRNFPNTHTGPTRSSNRHLSSDEGTTTGTSQSSFHYDNLFVKNANSIGSMHSGTSSSSSSTGKTGSQGGTTGGSSSSQLNDYYEKQDGQASTASPATTATEATEHQLATEPAEAHTDSNTDNADNTHESIIRRGSSGSVFALQA